MKLKILTGFYNAETYIERCLTTIKYQSYKDFICYITHDLSTDNSKKIVEEFIKGDDRFVLMEDHDKKLYQTGNFDKTIRNNPDIEDNDVLIEVDGDDFLPDDKVFERVAKLYEDNDVWITNGSFMYSNGTVGFSQQQEGFDNLRNVRWTGTHLRTWRAFLWRAIKEEDLKDEEGNYWQWSGDLCFMYPMLEMAGKEHYRFMSEINYVYNGENPINEHKLDLEMVSNHANQIRSKKPYEPLEHYVKN
jgi:glycosyltransferase involved in cell wall biosynthesis